MESDVALYVVGSMDDNEVLLYNVILALRDSLHLLFKSVSGTPLADKHLGCSKGFADNSTLSRQSVDKRTIIENYDLVALLVDELVDDGIILETDPTIVVQRCSKAPSQDVVNISSIDPFSEQGVHNLTQLGKAKIADWLRTGL